jgi:ribonuclease-3
VPGKLGVLQENLGYQFADPELLALALSHRSCGNSNNERLEFLGDSILNHIIAAELYRRFPDSREGELSRMRASLVRGETLAELAREVDLGLVLRLGPGEMKSGGRHRNSILADTLEAIVGAMLLEAGLETCRNHVLRLFAERLDQLSPKDLAKDAKTRLQEFLQGRGKSLPDYQLISVEGEDHCQQFAVSCELQEYQMRMRGEGSSRRRAEQEAARLALLELDVRD